MFVYNDVQYVSFHLSVSQCAVAKRMTTERRNETKVKREREKEQKKEEEEQLALEQRQREEREKEQKKEEEGWRRAKYRHIWSRFWRVREKRRREKATFHPRRLCNLPPEKA